MSSIVQITVRTDTSVPDKNVLLKESEKLCKNMRRFGIQDELCVAREKWCLIVKKKKAVI